MSLSLTELKEKVVKSVNDRKLSNYHYVRLDTDKYIKLDLTNNDLSVIVDTDTAYKDVTQVIIEHLDKDITEQEKGHWNLLKDIMEV